jgi:sugar transferase (PEP-CTERM/EpsH1 system associated)
MPEDRYRHAIVCLTDYTNFRNRIRRGDVPVVALDKTPGRNLELHRRFYEILKSLRPSIVHTRNLSALEFQVTATLAGVPARIHGEHGRDIYDLDGKNVKYNLLRMGIRPFVDRYIAVSRDLGDWLVGTVGIREDRVSQIYNGVDSERFRPARGLRPSMFPEGFCTDGTVVVGTVGRLEPVKDPLTLFRAFLCLLEMLPEARGHLRLVAIGDGALMEEGRAILRKGGAESQAWIPGERSDVPELLRGLDLFVLPSLREGISNTILEAMATGLPVVATRVGGNPELVEEGRTGALVPPGSPEALANAIREFIDRPERLHTQGQAGRKRVEERFSLAAMVSEYLGVYDALLRDKSCAA